MLAESIAILYCVLNIHLFYYQLYV